MKFRISVTEKDVRSLRKLKLRHINTDSVSRAKKRNLNIPYRWPTRKKIWHGFVIAITTTQQRVSASSPAGKIGKGGLPNFLSMSSMKNMTQRKLARHLRQYGFGRLIPTMSERLVNIYQYLENGGWRVLKNDILKPLQPLRTKKARWSYKAIITEKFVADQLAGNENFKGIGPKQARNFLQYLGLTRFETPLDSRVLNFLKKTSTKAPLAQSLFQDRDYYNFVMNAFQEMCRRAGLFPCIADKIIFNHMQFREHDT